MTEEQKLIARYVELINSYLERISFANQDELKIFIVATKSINDYFSLPQFADLKGLYDDADLYAETKENIEKFKALISEQIKDWINQLPSENDTEKQQIYLNANYHKTVKPRTNELPKPNLTFSSAQLNIFKKYIYLQAKGEAKQYAVFESSGKNQKFTHELVAEATNVSALLRLPVEESLQVLTYIYSDLGTSLDDLTHKFIDFATKPEEIHVYLDTVKTLCMLLEYSFEKNENVLMKHRIRSSYKSLLFKYCGYDESASLRLLGEGQPLKDINSTLNNIKTLFSGSKVTLKQFGSYERKVQEMLLKDPDSFTKFTDMLNRKSFKFYLRSKQLALDLNKISSNEFTPSSIKTAMLSTKVVRELLGKKNKLQFSKTKEYLNDVVDIFETYIAQNNLSHKVFSKHTLSELLTLAKQQKDATAANVSSL